MPNKLSAADKIEMVSDARDYLKAAGIPNPTAQQIIAQIEAEHGSVVADGVYEIRLAAVLE